MQIFLTVLTIIIVISALIFGFYKQYKNKKERKNKIKAMTPEEREIYYQQLEILRLKTEEKMKKDYPWLYQDK